MTTAPDVAVVATQLAQTDRRALSQAWYSALHLAHDDGAPRAGASAHPVTPAPAPHEPARCGGTPGRHANAAAPAHAAPARSGRATDAAPLERRSEPTAADRRVGHAIVTIARTPRRPVSRTIALEGGRVRLLVRSDGAATRIVALCSEPLRATVERALAQARFALATRGDAVVPPS